VFLVPILFEVCASHWLRLCAYGYGQKVLHVASNISSNPGHTFEKLTLLREPWKILEKGESVRILGAERHWAVLHGSPEMAILSDGKSNAMAEE
jgi:hypothetical protein